MRANTGHKAENLNRTRRFFFANLCLFVGTLTVFFFLLAGESGDGSEAATKADEAPAEPLSLPEHAHLKGQVAALRENPATVPEFDEARARQFCSRMVMRDPSLTATPEHPIESLVEAYYQGYKERYDDYFDASIARKLGYKNGLKWDPFVHPMPDLRAIGAGLAAREAALQSRFQLDRPCWVLFVEAFCESFRDGYDATREGVTAKPGDRMLLDFE